MHLSALPTAERLLIQLQSGHSLPASFLEDGQNLGKIYRATSN